MFGGNGDLMSSYSFGAFSGDPLQASDFQIPFDVYPGMQILFITGDQSIWGLTSYSQLRALIDGHDGSMSPNITFDARIGGVEQQTVGNILSLGFLEDPWIGLQGDHGASIAAALIAWGENDFDDTTGERAALKNAHLGINVFVTTTPIPAALPLFASGL